MALTVHRCDGFLRITGTGVLSRRTIEEAVLRLMGNGHSLGRSVILWDLRSATLDDLTGTELQRLAAFVEARCSACVGARTALLVGSEAAYGVARMWELLTEDELPIQSEVFRSRLRAEEWLGSGF